MVIVDVKLKLEPDIMIKAYMVETFQQQQR